MTKIPGVKFKEVGNIYGLRNWIEYGLKQSKNELGWADFRSPDYPQIQKWWEIVMSAYLLVSLHSQNLHNMRVKVSMNQPINCLQMERASVVGLWSRLEKSPE